MKLLCEMLDACIFAVVVCSEKHIGRADVLKCCRGHWPGHTLAQVFKRCVRTDLIRAHLLLLAVAAAVANCLPVSHSYWADPGIPHGIVTFLTVSHLLLYYRGSEDCSAVYFMAHAA